MDKLDLASSNTNRQNILNNRYAIEALQKATGINGLLFEEQYRFLNEQVASFFEVDVRTIRNYLEKYSDELKNNGYEILKDTRLEQFKKQFGKELNIKPKTPQLGVFNFKAFLNLTMLLVDSERARVLRGVILDIAIDTINQKTGGNTKYINQRDENFVIKYFKGEYYREEFALALQNCVNLGNIKYELYLDKIYYSIFKEKADEYRRILNLSDTEDERRTMYAEILLLISSFEFGLAKEMEKKYNEINRKLEYYEVDEIFNLFINQPLFVPLIEDARVKMASRDYGFKGVYHTRLEDYIRSIPIEDFEKFIGQKSKSLEEWLEESKDIFKRLKDRT